MGGPGGRPIDQKWGFSFVYILNFWSLVCIKIDEKLSASESPLTPSGALSVPYGGSAPRVPRARYRLPLHVLAMVRLPPWKILDPPL